MFTRSDDPANSVFKTVTSLCQHFASRCCHRTVENELQVNWSHLCKSQTWCKLLPILERTQVLILNETHLQRACPRPSAHSCPPHLLQACPRLVMCHMWVTATQLRNTLLRNSVIASGNRSLLLPTSLSCRCSLYNTWQTDVESSVVFYLSNPTYNS